MSEAMSASSSAIIVGYYGKVHTRGDFVSRGLPRQFREPWDAWLQEVIHVSQQQLGSTWKEQYLTFPLYRFVLSAGVCGEQAWLGVIMPSIDQVGRYYPMTLCRSLINLEHLFEAFGHYQTWYEQAEALLLSCLADEFALNSFEQQVITLEQQLNQELATATPKLPSHSMKLIQKHPQGAWRVEVGEVSAIGSLPALLLPVLLQDCCVNYSLWFTYGSERYSPSFLLAKGLPPFTGATALLDGQWQQWDWKVVNTPMPTLPIT